MIRMKFPEGSRPKAKSSFELSQRGLADRFKLAVVLADEWEDDLMVWTCIGRLVEKHLDPVILVRTPMDAAARWGHWHWTPVRIYGEEEEDLFMSEADQVLIVGGKQDVLLNYYRELARYYNKRVAWASPKEV